jgi:hypothetical protein
MPTPDPAKAIKDAVAGDWSTTHPSWTATLHVDDDFKPAAGSPVLLVANDGGPAVLGGAWLVRKTPRREVMRLTGFGAGRGEARSVVDAGVDYVLAHKPGISRIEDVSSLLETRDRATGAFLASITVPVIVRPTS